MKICDFFLLLLQGPDFIQVGTAVISVLAMILISFPYVPLISVLNPYSLWTPVIMNWITRFLSLACSCVVSVFFYFVFILVNRIHDAWVARRRNRRFFEES